MVRNVKVGAFDTNGGKRSANLDDLYDNDLAVVQLCTVTSQSGKIYDTLIQLILYLLKCSCTRLILNSLRVGWARTSGWTKRKYALIFQAHDCVTTIVHG